MSTNWCRGFGAAPWEFRYFPLSPVFVGLKCAQASRVSVYLLAFTFLSVVFIDFLPRFFCFLDKAGVFVGSSVVVPPVFPFFSPCLPCPLVFCFLSLHSEKAELKINYNWARGSLGYTKRCIAQGSVSFATMMDVAPWLGFLACKEILGLSTGSY